MVPQAQAIWDGLEFRKPALLRLIEPLSTTEFHWRPEPARNSIAWQVWHIAEVEDNRIRTVLLDEPHHYPFGKSVRETAVADYPGKEELSSYLHEVRDLSRRRLEALREGDFSRTVEDAHFGTMTVSEVWAGVVTSFAWHAGQVVLTCRLLGL